MSDTAQTRIAEQLAENGEMEFEALQGDLENHCGVQWNTARNYIYKYAEYEERNGERLVSAMANDEDPETILDQQEVQEMTPGDFGMDDPTPASTGTLYKSCEVREPGHPRVPSVREFIQRPMGGPDVQFEMDLDIDENSTLLDVYSQAKASADFGVLMIGPPGTGKGHTARKHASMTNEPLVRVNFGARITKEKLVGGFVPRENGDGLDEVLERAESMADDHDDLTTGEALETLGSREKFVWKDGLLTKAVRNGWDFLADELNAASAEALMPLHGLLEDADSRTLELLEKGEVVEVHEDFSFIGTMNPPHHAGTHRMNEALMGRLIPVPVPYLAEAAEAGLVADRTGLTRSEAEDLVDMAHGIRSTKNTPPCSPRELFKIGEMAEIMPLESAVRMILLGLAEDSNQKDAVEKRIEMSF